jgi:hypothetical protein
MNTSRHALTTDEQNQVHRAGEFVTGYDAGRDTGQDSYALGAAVEHLRGLLAIIGDLTGDAS